MQTRLALIGFGEAGQSFASGWQEAVNPAISAYDIKTDHKEMAAVKLDDYARTGVTGCKTCKAAIADAAMIFSLVTAEQSLIAAENVAKTIAPGTWFFDCNSCAPDTKRRANVIISKAGGHYVDVAVLGPVGPVLEKIPLLISGDEAAKALPLLAGLGMGVKHLPGDVGRASSVKMVRSIMMKGLEALALECVLSARKAGVEDEVLQSLEVTYPGFNWVERSGHMLERVMTHGIRRAEEMREVAKTVDDLGFANDMARAIVEWDQRIGDLTLKADEGADVKAHADQITAALKP